jgi:hypothetical protein
MNKILIYTKIPQNIETVASGTLEDEQGDGYDKVSLFVWVIQMCIFILLPAASISQLLKT